jgi:hypothetical protein
MIGPDRNENGRTDNVVGTCDPQADPGGGSPPRRPPCCFHCAFVQSQRRWSRSRTESSTTTTDDLTRRRRSERRWTRCSSGRVVTAGKNVDEMAGNPLLDSDGWNRAGGSGTLPDRVPRSVQGATGRRRAGAVHRARPGGGWMEAALCGSATAREGLPRALLVLGRERLLPSGPSREPSSACASAVCRVGCDLNPTVGRRCGGVGCTGRPVEQRGRSLYCVPSTMSFMWAAPTTG